MKRPPSAGVCQLCQGTFGKAAMTRHLRSCLAKLRPRHGKERQLVHLVVEGYGPYWLHVEMPGAAKFRDLDNFLRGIWLECCGHLSAFQFKPEILDELNLGDDSPSEFEFPEDELMDYEVAEVLAPKLAFGYEYDFGSTTKLRLKVAGIRMGAWAGKERVRLLARNLPPQRKCNECGKPGEWIDVEADIILCAPCAEKDDGEFLLPVVNSPRMGVCGYTGEY